jgi:hypothetical protein
VFGFSGAKAMDRGVLMMYFVLLLWGVASSTSNINANITERQKQSDICSHTLTSQQQAALSGVQACEPQLFVLTIKLVAIATNLVLQLVSAWISLRLSEKIQEEQEGEEKANEAKTAMEINFRRKSMAVTGKRKGSVSMNSVFGDGAPAGPLAAMLAASKR